MAVLADIILVAAALGATFYCIVLSRRLNRFTDLEKGVGGAISVLSAQVDDMTRALKSAQGSAISSAASLGDLTGRAEDAARRLELLVASMHDLPAVPPVHQAPPERAREPEGGAAIDLPTQTQEPPAALFSSRRNEADARA